MEHKKQNIFQIIFFLLAANHLAAIAFSWQAAMFVTKMAAVPALMAWLLTRATKSKGRNTVAAGLLFSFFGDSLLLLESRGEIFFILGLVCFLITHILYIIYFLSIRSNETSLLKKQPLLFAAVTLFGVSLVWFLFPHLHDLKIPVMVYAATICSMLLCSLHVFFKTGKPERNLFVAGALLFVTSDSLLAISKFYQSFPSAQLLIMLTYLAAQYCIAKGAILREKNNQ